MRTDRSPSVRTWAWLRQIMAEPARQRKVDLLEQQISALIEIATKGIEGRQETGAIPAKALLLEGKRRMDDVRASIAEMQSEESNLLDQRMARAREARHLRKIIASASTLMGMILLLLAGFGIGREINNGTRMRGQLKALNADLERRVEQRTAALQQSQGQLQAIIQSAMDAIITVDEQQRIVLFNAAAETMFRCPDHGALGSSLDRFIPQRSRAAHAEHHRNFARSGITSRRVGKLGTLEAVRADGEHFHVEIAISQAGTEGSKLFTAIVRDITERRRSEEELAEKVSELARSNRELEQFAYVASHDLQEPLRMVASYTQLLAERYRGKLDENADRYIGYAVEGALRMQTLIQDLLAFSRVGRNGQNHKNTDCNTVLETALQNLRAAIQESGAVVTHSGLPTLSADSSQMVQLFQNLIGNAIKFRGKATPLITVSGERKGAEWLFTVADNGIGIALEHQDTIFVIFQRPHTRAEYPGNGVGLAICKKIVEHHGGRIWVESEPGHGAAFQFTFPSELAHERRAQPK